MKLYVIPFLLMSLVASADLHLRPYRLVCTSPSLDYQIELSFDVEAKKVNFIKLVSLSDKECSATLSKLSLVRGWFWTELLYLNGTTSANTCNQFKGRYTVNFSELDIFNYIKTPLDQGYPREQLKMPARIFSKYDWLAVEHGVEDAVCSLE